MLLYYIRHGDPVYNPDSLTPLGERQAEAVGKRLSGVEMDEIIASTSNRAYLTALPLSEMTKKEIRQEDFLNEGYAWKYFTMEREGGGHMWAYQNDGIRAKFVSREVAMLGDAWYTHPCFDGYRFGEGVAFFEEKIDAFLRQYGYEHDRSSHTYRSIGAHKERIAVFAHEGIGSIFLSSILDLPYPLFAAHYAMAHTGVTVISFADEGDVIIPQMYQHSCDGHLYSEGLPRRYNNRLTL